MWSRTQNYPLDNNDDQLSIINRFFDFMNNTRRLNNRIIEQNDNLAEMGYEMVIAFIYSSRNSNTNRNTNRNTSGQSEVNNTNSASNSGGTSNNTRPTNSRTRVRSRNNRSTISSRYNLNNRYTNLRNDWRNINRNTNTNTNRNLWQRNVRPRNINQSPLSNIIPMFGSLPLQPVNNTNLEQLFQQALQPVLIRPTPEQIDRATEERTFDQINQPINDTCPITRNRFNNSDTVLQILECRHNFTPTSLRTWFETSVRCPICRYDIREYNPMNVVNNPYRNNDNNNDDNNNDDIENNNDDIENNNDDIENNNDDIENNNDNGNSNDDQSVDTQDEATVDTASSQDIARELVMNELNNINNDPSISDEQRNIANLISQTMTVPNVTEELIQTESSIDSNGNLNLTYQFGIIPNLPPSET